MKIFVGVCGLFAALASVEGQIRLGWGESMGGFGGGSSGGLSFDKWSDKFPSFGLHKEMSHQNIRIPELVIQKPEFQSHAKSFKLPRFAIQMKGAESHSRPIHEPSHFSIELPKFGFGNKFGGWFSK